MAKKSQVARDEKRRAMYQKYRHRREELKAARRAAQGNPTELARIQFELAKLPANSSPTRLNNRCIVTVARALTSAGSGSRASPSARWPTRATCPASPSRAGRRPASHGGNGTDDYE